MGIPDRVRTRAPYVVAVAFTVSGVIHLVKPSVFTSAVPHVLPGAKELVYASGVAELACAAGLYAHKPWAGKASALLLLAVLPANLQMALDAGTGRNPGIADNAVALWARLPLQVPLIWAALQEKGRTPA